MTPSEKALIDAVAYLQGLGDSVGPEQGAAMVATYLARAGYSVQAIAGPVLHDLAPGTLRKVRGAKALTATQVATEAGTSLETVRRAETEGKRLRPATLENIAGAAWGEAASVMCPERTTDRQSAPWPVLRPMRHRELANGPEAFRRDGLALNCQSAWTGKIDAEHISRPCFERIQWPAVPRRRRIVYRLVLRGSERIDLKVVDLGGMSFNVARTCLRR